MRTRPPAICCDCGKTNPPMFILRNEVWETIAKVTDLLCFHCAQNRLGRKIVWADLKPCLMTDELRLGAEIHRNTVEG